jgi:hypothetical protein
MSKLFSLWVVLCFLMVFGFWKGLRGCRMFYYALVLLSVFASLRGSLFPLSPIEGKITTLYFARFPLSLPFLFGLVSKSPSEDVTTALFLLLLYLFFSFLFLVGYCLSNQTLLRLPVNLTFRFWHKTWVGMFLIIR